MLTLIEIPGDVETKAALARSHARLLRPLFERIGVEADHPRETEVLQQHPNCVLYVADGVLRHEVAGKLVRFVGEDDIVVSGEGPLTSLSSDFAAHLLVCPRAAFFEALTGDPAMLGEWLAYRELEIQVLGGLVSAHATEHVDPPADFVRFEPDEAIIHEGDPSGEIFAMVHGEARVLANGVAVGDIHEGEVFGEMGFLTERDRTATVIAVNNCLVQRIGHEDFERLIHSRPQLVIELCRTLARRVASLNDRLAKPQ